METKKDVPTHPKLRPQLLNRTENSVGQDVSGQLRVMEGLDCNGDRDSWCLEDICKRDPKIEALALKMLLVQKDTEYEEMKKCKQGLQGKLNELCILLKRYESLDEERTICSIQDDPPRLNHEKNFNRKLLEENQQLKQKFDEEIKKADNEVAPINQFEQNEVVDRLLISNDDLINEFQQLKKKLKESESALAILEDQLERLRTVKLREMERTNSLACELALTQAKALHLEQLAHVEVGRMMSGSSSSFRSGSVRQHSSLLQEPKRQHSSLLQEPMRQHSSLLQEPIKETKTDIPVLRPTIVKVHDCVDDVPPSQVTQKGSPEKTEVKPTC